MESEWRQTPRRNWIVPTAVLLLAGVLVWGALHTQAPDLSASRPSYDFSRLDSRVSNLITRWRNSGWDRLTRPRQGNTTGSTPVYLVIDVNKNALWLERGGQVAEVEKVSLPEAEYWRVQCVTPSGSTPLKSPVYLKWRQEPQRSEMIVLSARSLPGSGGRGSGKYIAFSLNGSGNGSSRGSVERISPSDYYNGREKLKSGTSIIVTPEELQADRMALAQAGALSPDPADATLFGEDARRWARMEDRILDEIMKRLPCPPENASLSICSPIPSFTAAHASFRLKPTRAMLLQYGMGKRTGQIPREAVFLIKYFKDGVWGVCGDKEFASTRFLVNEDSRLDLKPYQILLEQMAADLSFVHTPDPKFMAHFANGTTVELVGLCECPLNSQSQWWKPDGTPLAEKPYYNYAGFGPQRSTDMSKRWLAIAMRVGRPGRGGPNSSTYSTGSSFGGGSFSATDEYGREVSDPTLGSGISSCYGTAIKKVDFTYGTGSSPDAMEKVRFKNIALYLGEKTDFKIIAEPAEAGQGDEPKQNGRP